MKDIFVDDEKYTALADFYEKACALLEEQISSYINILNSVPEDAMKGNTAQEIKMLGEMAGKFSGVISDIGETMSLTIQNYLSSIDTADEYLYSD